MSNNNITIEEIPDYLKGKTIGILSYEFNDEEVLEKMKNKLKDIGVNLVEIDDPQSKSRLFDIIDGIYFKNN